VTTQKSWLLTNKNLHLFPYFLSHHFCLHFCCFLQIRV
jgi:hypothetical protein